jgi:hypothetical protein
MASSKKGQVTLRGRFSKGAIVTLTKVAGEHVLRPEGGEDVETKTVGERDGVAEVQFTGLEVDARYIAHGLEDGRPIMLRARGREADADSEVLAQPPVRPDRTRLPDGSWSDERPTKESPPPAFVGPGPGQHQVPEGTPQRSDTFRGSAHPVDPDEQAPYRRQEDVPEGTPQMSDTRPREVDGVQVGGGGAAAELVLGPQRQEDVKASVPQRSSTPAGVAQVIPSGDAIEAHRVRESSFAKETRGEPGRAAAEPVDPKGATAKPPSGATAEQSAKRHEQITASDKAPASTGALPGAANIAGREADRENRSGLDAQGQPVDPGVAAAAGVEPASKPAEPVGGSRKSSAGKDPAKVKAGKAAAAKRAAAKKSSSAASSSGSKSSKEK